MARHRVTAPRESWPCVLRAHFDELGLSPAQDKRLGAALGRWVLCAEDPFDVTPAGMEAACTGLSESRRKSVEAAMRQVLGLLFPDRAAALQVTRARRPKAARNSRGDLAAHLTRHLPRFAAAWQAKAVPLLHIDPDGLQDGLLVQAWKPATITRRIETMGRYFDVCRAQDLSLDVTSAGVRTYLAHLQAGGARPATAYIDLIGLHALARVIFPERNWTWLVKTQHRMKKLSEASPSRNAGRALPVDEIRMFGLEIFAEADRAFDAARTPRDFTKAHTLARTGLAIIILAEAPMRIGSLASVELGENLLASLAALRVDGVETKTGDPDTRVFSAECVRCLGAYIARHRAAVVKPGETRLFVGFDGCAIVGSTLSNGIGRLTEERLGKRMTAHPFRHAAGNFIVASVPEEAALATVILGHRSRAITGQYTRMADQFSASRTYAQSTGNAAAQVEANTQIFRTRRRRKKRVPKQKTRAM
ncbi:tyrosine-type recombinase/integrase [Rhodovulum adriaticum]|uniref:Site-specific recombinase XerD n=1 Tax=Rhodovulum adriaticum TaxID=35804 RepID=A0A4V2SKT7_RHOAD|nr:tyrosine-type recombinase/integrase [Rhodovulum adriaticum]MBK1636789.1 hypothetical protein [Rhodovulum adriaticum]TCP20696.1 site-specific recombinase XerD [Rhodovulum adriaticum]